MNTAPKLSTDQIEKGWRETFSVDNPFCPCDLKSFTKAVNWTLRALAPPSGEGVDSPPMHLVGQHNGRLHDLDYAATCLDESGYQFTAAAKVRRVRDWIASQGPATPQSAPVDGVSDDDVWEAHCAYTDVYDGHGSERPAMRAALEGFVKSRQQEVSDIAQSARPNQAWYRARIMETLDDDFMVAPPPASLEREDNWPENLPAWRNQHD